MAHEEGLAGLFKLIDRTMDKLDDVTDGISDLKDRVKELEVLNRERERDKAAHRAALKARIEEMREAVEKLQGIADKLPDEPSAPQDRGDFWKKAAAVVAGLGGIAAAAWQAVKNMGGTP